jgi:hypothetical protein
VFVFVLSVLTYVLVFDFRKCEVFNWLWVFVYPVGCVMMLAGLLFNLLTGVASCVMSISWIMPFGYISRN